MNHWTYKRDCRAIEFAIDICLSRWKREAVELIDQETTKARNELEKIIKRDAEQKAKAEQTTETEFDVKQRGQSI